MSFNGKAFLLSAFILPGLGQLFKGDRLKGAAIIALVNVFLLIALFLVLKGAGIMHASTALDPGAQATAIMAGLKTTTPVARVILCLFSALWLYSAADAAFK